MRGVENTVAWGSYNGGREAEHILKGLCTDLHGEEEKGDVRKAEKHLGKSTGFGVREMWIQILTLLFICSFKLLTIAFLLLPC